jgi:amidohydrolase
MADVKLPAVRPAVAELADELVAVRRNLHRHAEVSRQEHRTQGVIIDRLRAIGVDDVRPMADTGVTCIVRGERPGPHLLWRADTDGLPLDEETGLPFASQNEGAMQACGHDGHVAIALGIADVLQRFRHGLAGSVRFAFQPAEEHAGGARRMIDEGIMRDPKVDRVFGLHILNPTRLGAIDVVPGAIFSSSTHFRIIIHGRGGHAGIPSGTIDPIVVAGHAIVALQTVVSRGVHASDTAVLSIGRIQGGVRGNVIPNDVMMSGTVRTFEEHVLERVLRRMEEILAGITAAWGAEFQFDHTTMPAVVNDPECATLVADVGAQFLGAENVGGSTSTGSDDMAYFLEEAPGAYFFLGGRDPSAEEVYPHHHPKFDFDERCLPLGVEMGLRIIERAVGCRLTSRTGRPVVIVDYDPAWPRRFEAERELILHACGEDAFVAVEHVGSTAVPGLAAKPIVDIMPGVRSLDDAPRIIERLTTVGYNYVPEYESDLPERRYLHKDVNGERAFHLHIVQPDSDFWERHLLFRDYLRSHPEAARAYEALKRELAERHGTDRVGYTDAKAHFVRECEAKARAERGGAPAP